MVHTEIQYEQQSANRCLVFILQSYVELPTYEWIFTFFSNADQ